MNPGAVASDIWRSFPSITQPFIKRIFLSTDQGCATSVAAAVGDFKADELYLQPYWMPESASHTAPYPVIEMMVRSLVFVLHSSQVYGHQLTRGLLIFEQGPFVGWKVCQPRLPLDGGDFAAKNLWRACEEITECQFE